MRWTGNVTRTELRRTPYKFVAGKLQGRDNFGHTDADRKIILKFITKEGCEIVDWIHLALDSSK
jgi:hypothetical protein